MRILEKNWLTHVDKTFLCVFQPTKRGASAVISCIHQCLQHWAQPLMTKRGPTAYCFLLNRYKKTGVFMNFREFLENFRHFWNNFRAFWGKNSGKNFRQFFGNYVAKPITEQLRVQALAFYSTLGQGRGAEGSKRGKQSELPNTFDDYFSRIENQL